MLKVYEGLYFGKTLTPLGLNVELQVSRAVPPSDF